VYDTLYFGGMLTNRWIWSAAACPSSHLTPFCSHNSREIRVLLLLRGLYLRWLLRGCEVRGEVLLVIPMSSSHDMSSTMSIPVAEQAT
jgi:hypothetical protein